MGKMLSALNLNNYSFENQFKKKSREELIQLRDETKKILQDCIKKNLEEVYSLKED